MKSKTTIIILSIIFTVLVVITAIFGIIYFNSPYFDNGEIFDVNNQATWCDDTPNFFKLPTQEDLDKLEKGMPIEEVVLIIGKPIKEDYLSSSFIYVWKVKDIGEVEIKFGRSQVGEKENGEPIYEYHYIMYKE